jgi:hypothetical protein
MVRQTHARREISIFDGGLVVSDGKVVSPTDENFYRSKGGTHRSRSLLNTRTQNVRMGVTTRDNMRALVLGLAIFAISAGAASAQQAVYPRYGYAPHGYGYGYHHRYYAYYPRYRHHRYWYRY